MAIDKIGSKALLDCSVAAADITPGTITATKLAGSIANAKLANSTVTINGTAIALGASASIAALAWQSVVVSDGSTVTTMVAGRGYFVNNTSAAGIVKLPAGGTAGDTIAIKDYAGNFGTNKLTIQRNGHNIQGVANDSLIGTNRASIELVYIDATKGWLYKNESNVADLQAGTFIGATGGTVTTTGNFKIHTFTGDSNFVVASLGNTAGGGATVDYLVVAGGGAGGGPLGGDTAGGGGGGAGGFRVSNSTCMPSPLTSPLATPTALTLSAQTYPITVGAGGGGGAQCGAGGNGSNSVFSTITSAGGGGGGASPISPAPLRQGQAGGSGGGAGRAPGGPNPGGNGNTPPVSPPQGQAGGDVATCNHAPNYGQGGGGGAGGAGNSPVDQSPTVGGSGGIGSFVLATGFAGSNGTTGPVSDTRYFAGGGGGATYQGGTPGTGGAGGGGAGNNSPNGPSAPSISATSGGANTGGGGGGMSQGGTGGAGGKGVVIIRYKFQ